MANTSDGLYSVNYIDIFSTTPPVVTFNDVTKQTCELECNKNSTCNGYYFTPQYTILCTSSNISAQLSSCKKVELISNSVNNMGLCYIIESSAKSVNPVYIKNTCTGYDEICSTIWYNQLVIFLVIFSILCLLNMALYNKCSEIKSMYYRRY